MPSEKVLKGLEELHQQLNRMQPVIRQVEVAEQLIREIKKLPEEHKNLIIQTEKDEIAFRQQLSQELTTHAQLLSSQVDKVVDSVQTTIKSLVEHEEQLSSISRNLETFYIQLASMHLDVRLDSLQKSTESKFYKVETQINTTQMDIQQLQGRIDLVESNLNIRLRDENDKLKNLLLQLQQQQKQQKTFTILTWLLITLAVVIILAFN